MTGAQYGKWGRDKYGVKPKKVDALEFYPDRLQELWRQIQEEQVLCGALLASSLHNHDVSGLEAGPDSARSVMTAAVPAVADPL